MLFIQRVDDGCYVIEQDGITVAVTETKQEAETLIRNFHLSVAERQRQELEVERERQERRAERREHYEREARKRWPGN